MTAVGSSINLVELGACTKLAVRAGPHDAAAVSSALGVDLPQRIGGLTGAEDAFAICLGPDEWCVMAPQGAFPAETTAAAAQVVPCSIVDVSARDLAFALRGAGAESILNTGCPADLVDMPERSAARTVFDHVQIVVIKWSMTHFHVHVWRSFAPQFRAIVNLAQSAPMNAEL